MSERNQEYPSNSKFQIESVRQQVTLLQVTDSDHQIVDIKCNRGPSTYTPATTLNGLYLFDVFLIHGISFLVHKNLNYMNGSS